MTFKIFKIIALGLFFSFSTFILAELGLRTIGWFKNIDYSVYLQDLTTSNRGHGIGVRREDALKYALRPNARNLVTTSDFSIVYETNSLGMRDQEYALTPPPDKKRILALGDSFTFGEGVPYGRRFTDIAEQNISSVEILNMAVPGYGIDQALLLFLEDGLKLRPDRVMLFINRVATQRYNSDIFRFGKLVSNEDQSSQSTQIKNVIDTNDKLLTPPSKYVLQSYFLAYAIYNFRLWQHHKEFAEHDKAEWGGLALETIVDTAEPQAETDHFTISRSKAIVAKLLEICTEHQIKLTVVNIDANSTLSYLKEMPGLDYVDLSKELSNAAQTFPLRFTYDLHFNENTNQFLGEKLTEIIRNRLN